MEKGHPFSRRYPLWQLWQEEEILLERDNLRVANDAIAVQRAVASLFSKDGADMFREYIEDLTSGQ